MSTAADHGALDFSALLEAFQDRIFLNYAVGPNRQGTLEIDGVDRRVRIRWPAADAEIVLRRYKNLRIQKTPTEGIEEMALLEVDASKSPSAAIAFATSVVAALAGGNAALGAGVLTAISGWHDIIDEFQILSRSRQIGLIGELLFLIHLVSTLGPDSAISAWLGPPKSEHDFALEEFEIEVKTTESERRIHTVSSETQLTESHGRVLYLLSIQLTQAGNSQTGFSLADLVTDVREVALDYRGAIDNRLEEAGWEDQFAELYGERFMFRTLPKLFAVDEQFPRITRDVLDQNLEKGDLVSRVSYRIDLSSIQEAPTQGFMARFGASDV